MPLMTLESVPILVVSLCPAFSTALTERHLLESSSKENDTVDNKLSMSQNCDPVTSEVTGELGAVLGSSGQETHGAPGGGPAKGKKR